MEAAGFTTVIMIWRRGATRHPGSITTLVKLVRVVVVSLMRLTVPAATTLSQLTSVLTLIKRLGREIVATWVVKRSSLLSLLTMIVSEVTSGLLLSLLEIPSHILSVIPLMLLEVLMVVFLKVSSFLV